MRVTSVNVGQKASLRVGQRDLMTGIFKQSVTHPIEVKATGVTGDHVLDKKHHGGPDQAVYIYRNEDYQFWAEQLGRDMPAGIFGENITVSGLEEPGLEVGDRLQMPNLTLEITAPRIPCSTLAARMGDPGFVKAFIQAERPGFYARVISPGTVAAGDSVQLVETELDSVSTITFYRDVKRRLSKAAIERYLSLPIDMRSRRDFEKKLAAMSAPRASAQ